MNEEELDNISFSMPKSKSNSIKVIGVGGGGSNAVNYMFKQGIKGVDFVICNTDAQALDNSDVPNKIQLGIDLTSGLGAGANPETGRKAAEESISEIKEMLDTQTKMVFITAGMGGGTGTGASPIIAKIAREMGILTVGIVTKPFSFEGRSVLKKSQIGISELKDNVDSLIIMDNNKLREVYGNLGHTAGYSKADEVVSTAARGIAEVITRHYKQNIDFNDVRTVLANSGTAIMGSATEFGDNRAINSIVNALDSPLLNDNKIKGAKNVLLLIVSGTGDDEITVDEIGEINDYIQDESGHETNIILGNGDDESLENSISITIIATGFSADQQSAITNTEAKKIIHILDDEQEATYDFPNDTVDKSSDLDFPINSNTASKTVYTLEEDDEEEADETVPLIPTSESIKNIDVVYDEIEIDPIPEDNFIITDITPKAEEINENKEITHIQPNLFDFPINNSTEIEEGKIAEKKYVLENFDIEPTISMSSKLNKETKIEIEDNLKFEVKTKPTKDINEIKVVSEEISSLSLAESELKKTAMSRRHKLKEHNYIFTNKTVDEMEREPACKRLAVNLDESNSEINKSRTTLGKDTKNDNKLRSNNSFLHDNVD